MKKKSWFQILIFQRYISIRQYISHLMNWFLWKSELLKFSQNSTKCRHMEEFCKQNNLKWSRIWSLVRTCFLSPLLNSKSRKRKVDEGNVLTDFGRKMVQKYPGKQLRPKKHKKIYFLVYVQNPQESCIKAENNEPKETNSSQLQASVVKCLSLLQSPQQILSNNCENQNEISTSTIVETSSIKSEM